MNRGRFITIEGIEGVGKSTNLEFVREQVAAAGHEVVVTREPGGTPLAEQVRQVVLDAEGEVPPLTELMLMFTARSAHVAQLIRPALEAGRWVVCDRYTDATMAYQGGGRGLDETLIRRLADAVHGDLWPDLTLLLDAPVEIGLGRAARRSAPDRFERETVAFFERVRARYHALAAAEPGRIRVIDAAAPLAAVRAAIDDALRPLLCPGR